MRESKGKYWAGIIPLLVIVIFQNLSLNAQGRKGIFLSKHRIELGVGRGMLLDVVSLTLSGTQSLNIPNGEFGFSAGFGYRYAATPHFSVGYQLDYLQISGKVVEQTQNSSSQIAIAATNEYGNSLIFDYYIKPVTRERYKFNYKISYKIGTISLKLADGNIVNNGIPQSISISEAGVGVINGFGVGAYYIVNKQIALLWKLDYNHISSTLGNIYRPYLLFTETPYTVSKYFISTVGLSYRIGTNKKPANHDKLPFKRK